MDEQTTIARQLRRMGPAFDPNVMLQTRRLFREPVQKAVWASTPPVSDLPYGAHPRQRVDLYPTSRPGAPVLLFVHGGGFVAGDKAGDPEFYGNVGRYFAHHGFLSATMNYRLAPEFGWPAGSEDVAAALHWLAQHAAEHGGDSSRIVVLGQSAGAAHAAGVLFDGRFAVPGSVCAAALLSGFYLAQRTMPDGPRSYFGNHEDAWEERSPARHVAKGHVPVLLSIAEFDPAAIAHQTLQLADALNDVDGRPPRIHWLNGQNHISTVHGLGLWDDPVGTLLREFFSESITDDRDRSPGTQ